MSVDPNEWIFIEAELRLATDRAIMVAWKTEDVWLPKSRIKYNEQSEIGDIIEIELPIWLARSKALI